MRFVSALGSFLLVRGVIAGFEECVDDEVLGCFSSSTVAASAFCSQSLTWSEAVTVTVAPTITSTQVITVTTDHIPSSIHPRKKRGTCTKKPLLRCLRSLATPIEQHQLTSACSCIGVATPTISEITGEPTVVTVTETSFAQQPAQSTASSNTWPSDAPTATPSSCWCQASTITETVSAPVIVSTVTATYISEDWSPGIPSATETFPITVTNECSTVQVTATQTVTETAIETSLNTLTEVNWVTVPITKTTTATETLRANTDTPILPSLATSVVTQTETVTVADSCSMMPPSTAISVSISTETTTTVTTETQTVTMTTTTAVHTTTPDAGLTNGAFESGSLAGWGSILLGAAPSANVTSPGAYDVGSAAYLSVGPQSAATLYQYLSCTPGKKYKFTFDAKRGPSTGLAGAWSVRVTLGTPMVTLESGFSDAAWTSYTKIWTCTNDLNGRFLQLIATATIGNAACAVWFDNFSLLPLSA